MEKLEKSDTNSILVLVTGATGNQGGELARQLLEKGHRVRAMTRNLDSHKALELKRLGAELIQGDFNDVISLNRVMKGVDTVFAMGTPFEKGTNFETKSGILLAKAAKAIGIKHFIYSSVGGANKGTGIPHFESKYQVEEEIKKLDLPFTIIGPVYFMENLLSPWSLPEIRNSRISAPLSSNRKLQMIALTDIAKFLVYIIEHHVEFLGKRIDIASDDISGIESAKILSEATDRNIEYIELAKDKVGAMGEDYIKMYTWFEEVGYDTDIESLCSTYPEVGWHKFEEWAKKQNWKVLLEPVKQEII